MLRLRTFGVKGIEIAYSEAVAGNILCSDLKIVSKENYAISGKTAIGIVIYNASGVLKAMALTGDSKPFEGYQSDNAYLTNRATQAAALTETDGTTNTTGIISWNGNDSNYAAGYCRAFSTAGRAAGNWDLPALGELKYIADNLSTIQSSLSTVSGTSITYGYYASSTECDGDYQWAATLNNGTYSYVTKQEEPWVRPITKITY